MSGGILPICWWGITDKGPYRKNNEDAFLALTFDKNEVRLLGKEGDADLSVGDFIFAVSDGMGGANAGEFASRIAVQKITETFPRHFRSGPLRDEAIGRTLLARLYDQIHTAIQRMGRHYEECAGMGATLSLLWLTSGRAYFAHAGDSRIYRLTPRDELVQLTQDHTHPGSLFRAGKINERECRYHPEKHQLQMVLGGRGSRFEPQIETLEYGPGDRFVLCTDGLIDGLWDHTIHKLLVNPVPRMASISPAKRLCQEALEVSGRDNTTVVIVEIKVPVAAN